MGDNPAIAATFGQQGENARRLADLFCEPTRVTSRTEPESRRRLALLQQLPDEWPREEVRVHDALHIQMIDRFPIEKWNTAGFSTRQRKCSQWINLPGERRASWLALMPWGTTVPRLRVGPHEVS
jgi:hypothetical protein